MSQRKPHSRHKKSFRDWDPGSKLLAVVLASWLFPVLLSAFIAIAGLGEIAGKIKGLAYVLAYIGFITAIGTLLADVQEAARSDGAAWQRRLSDLEKEEDQSLE
jgi:MFS-type transporter involved in bile tolerance (Atg22 family)